MKYTVECGAYVQYLRNRKITVCAKSEEEAKEKAVEKFEKAFKDAEDVSTVFIDSCEEEG